MSGSPNFVHLNLHTEYSLVDSLVRVKPLAQRVAELDMPAVAMTDLANLFAMVKFYRATQQQGVKPLIGVDLAVMPSDRSPGGRILLLTQNEQGYRNLTNLVTRAHLEGKHQGQARIEQAWLNDVTDGLICLSGGCDGPLGLLPTAEAERSVAVLDSWRRLFPDRFYLEISRTGRPREEACLAAAVELAISTDTPVVATNPVRFLDEGDFEAHEARVCIQEGRTLGDPRRPRNYTKQQYLRSAEEMSALFSDLPAALENTVEIARRCSLTVRLGENFLPAFPLPEGQSEEAYIQAQAEQGLKLRLTWLEQHRPAFAEPDARAYHQRLASELETIKNMGFSGYFLIVSDFIRWARENDVPVGPGRGSGAGSLVAYALRITEVDPIEHDLLFERFLNPERVSMPDFDIDFCMDGRDRVIDYVANHYGRDRVSQIITYGSMAARAVVRDVGRVLSLPYGQVDRIAKLVPFEIGMTLDKALEQAEEFRQLYDSDDEARELIDLGRQLEGLARNAGRHAGGVVISPSVLTDFTPLYREQGGEGMVTQFDKDDVEAVGLVKFDFLGLRTLTIIDLAVKAVRVLDPNRSDFSINAIPMDDSATFDLLKRCETTGIFQLESRGMTDLVERLQPDCFDDVVALVALFRPGPLQSGMVDDFINRKHGRAKVDTLHPDLDEILRPTYGVIVYQEQVMQIAQVLAGYSLGQADMLRRAMGKKKPEEMAKERAIFMA
ncbi:MAG: DNA polymerase III subunit alpha, partial [Gammaproteobacteria bacterium]|nr:DNA polymerase III subunit alpha [Gammaproteobacteria bacterium]